MKPEKVWAALELYDRDLVAKGTPRIPFTDAEYDEKLRGLFDRDTVLAHCRWMIWKCLTAFRPEYEAAIAEARAGGYGITRCVEMMEEAFKPLGKAMRWLCYIQGACHVLGLYSCNELRDHSRGGEGVFKTPAEEHAPHGGSLWPLAFPPDPVPADLRALWDADVKRKHDSGSPPGEYPCCEGVRRVEAVPGDATTLLGGLCPNHGATRNVPLKMKSPSPVSVNQESSRWIPPSPFPPPPG